MIEGALVMLAFFGITMGVMDFGRMVWSYAAVSSGAREATRYAIVHGSGSGNTATVSQIQGIVTGKAVGLAPANTTTTVTFSPDQSAGSTVTVAVSYSFYPIAPFVPIGPITLKSTSKRVIYQ